MLGRRLGRDPARGYTRLTEEQRDETVIAERRQTAGLCRCGSATGNHVAEHHENDRERRPEEPLPRAR